MNKCFVLLFFFTLQIFTSANAQQMQMVKDLNPGFASSYPRGLTVANGKLFFAADINNTGQFKLYLTEGTSATTQQLLAVDGSNIQNLIAYKNKIYFSCHDATNGQELWVSDGTVAGTKLFMDIIPGSNGSYPEYFTVCNNKLFFRAVDQLGGYDMYITDGTAAGTIMLQQYVDVLYGLSDFGILNNSIYFRGVSGTGQGYGLWKSDGTAAGTSLFTASNSINPVTIYATDIGFTEYNSSIYFSGSCSDITNGGYELTKLVATIPTSFSFTGNGNWSNPANWAGGIVPPSTLPSGSVVTINGACILDVAQHIASGATLIVAAGKSLVINGSLIIS